MDDESGGRMTKRILVKDLKRITEDLDDKEMLRPNVVGNLSIINPEGQYIGYVEINLDNPKIEKFDNE